MPPKSIVRVPRTQDSDSSNTTTYPILVLSLTQALNAANTSVTYTNPTGLGTLSSAGLYSAPITLTATSGDGTQSATANIILAPGAGTPLTETKVAHVISIIAASLCRREHLAPVVDPGFDITTNLGCPTCAALTGSYISYTVAPGTPALSYTWTLVPGPGTVTFASQNAASTPVSFSAAGSYTLQLSVFDGLATGLRNDPRDRQSASHRQRLRLHLPHHAPRRRTSPHRFAHHSRPSTQRNLFNGGPITLTISGANPATLNLTADGNGYVRYTYYGRDAGNDVISGTATGWCCAPTFSSNILNVSWINEPVKLTSSPVTGRFYTADGSRIFNTLPMLG